MNTAIDEFRTKVICNRIRNNRPIESAAKIKISKEQLKHLQKCKVAVMSNCLECRTILSKLEVSDGSK